MLNVFLAIAVDNLAAAQEMTAEQEEAEALAREQKEKSAAKEANMFLPTQIETKPAGNETANKNNPNAKTNTPAKPNTANKQPVNTMVTTTANNPTVTTTSTIPTANNKDKKAQIDVDKMTTRKVNLDYIPGLDDEDLKVILPASFEASLANCPLIEDKKVEEEKKEEKKEEEQQQDDENGPRPMLPYSSMFILGPENWYF